jgi:NADH-quinone oxidoreductase subunit G
LSIQPPGEAREDWAILRAFSATIGHKLPYDDLAGVRDRLVQVNPVFAVQQELQRHGCTDLSGPAAGGELSDAPFQPAVPDYYQTNAICRASATMAECTRTYTHPMQQAAE